MDEKRELTLILLGIRSGGRSEERDTEDVALT
jgi:hypothetical protein